MGNFDSPLLSKDAVKYITQNITPEQVQYVADIKNIYNDAEEELKDKNCENCNKECVCEEIVFLTKIIAFSDKFRALHWSAKTMSYHNALDEFCDEIESFKDAIAENIQSIIGQFEGFEFTTIKLPIDNNPLVVINELKVCVNNFLKCVSECGEEYEGVRNILSGFLETVHKYIYIFRLCKQD